MTSPSPNPAPDFPLLATGEMAELFRSHDWSRSSLGPPETWPPSLSVLVDHILASPLPSALFFGPDLAILYNDAYRPFLSRKHPASLGQPGAQVWQEAWPAVELHFNSVLAGRAVTLSDVLIPIDQQGALSDFFWNITLSPIFHQGRIVGVFDVSQDTTARVLADRDLRESEARSNRILQSIGDAVIVTDEQTRVTGMNPVAEHLTGWPQPEALGKPLAEIFRIVNEETRQPVENPADKVARLNANADMTRHTLLLRRDGSEIFIDDSSAPVRDEHGALTGIVLVFRDIGEKRAAEADRERLRLNAEARFAELEATYKSAAVAMAIIDAGTLCYLRVNDQLCELLGQSPAQVIGSHISSVAPNVPNVIETLMQVAAGIPALGVILEGELTTSPGKIRTWTSDYQPIFAADGTVIAIAAASTEITEIKRAERTERDRAMTQEFLLSLLHQQRETTDPNLILKEAAEALGTFLKADRTGFYEMAHPGFFEFTHTWNAPTLTGPMPPMPQFFPIASIGSDYALALNAGVIAGIPDISVHPLTADTQLDLLGVRALIGLSILRRGRWMAGAYVNQATVRQWTDEEVLFAREVAELTWDAVERARAQQALRQSEERLRVALLVAGGVGTFDWDVQGDLLYSDQIFAHLFGLDPASAAAGTPLPEILARMHPEDRTRVAQAITDATRTGQDYSEEYRLLQHDGSTLWVSAKGRCLLAPDGTPLRFPGVIIDITPRRRMEEDLRLSRQQLADSESQLRLITDALPAYVAYLDSDLRYLRVNRTYLEDLKLPPEKIVGHSIDEVLGESAANVRLQLQAALDGETQQFEASIDTATGARTLAVTHIPDRGPDGSIRGVVVQALDITARKQTEAALIESEERFRRLSDSAPVGVYMADLAGRVNYVNPLVTKIFSLTQDELLTHGWLQRVHPEDADRVLSEWSAANAANLPYQTEYRLLLPEDEIRYIAGRSTPFADSTGKPTGVVGTVDDITTRILSEAALRQTEKLAAVGRLSASIAHEINNPLESVTNLLYLARNSQDVPEIQVYLTTAERELRRVSAISSQTLRFHKQATSPRPVTCDDLLDSVLSIYQGRLLNSHIQVSKDRRTNRAVLCFEGEIRQVLANLIGNAIDAMSPTGGRLLIRSREASQWPSSTHLEPRRGLAITVADTGTGMSPATVRRMFEPFFTTKGIGGTGLGLWVTREIVDRHQGALTVRSSQHPQHHGTVFTLFLPFDAALR